MGVRKMAKKVRLYSTEDGRFFGRRIVYHGEVNEFGDRDEYYLDRHGNKRLLALEGLEVAPQDRDKIVSQ